MRFSTLFALAAPALVSAIQFVEPEANSTLSKGETYTLKWDTVDTDPENFSIYLVNFVNWPPLYTPLAYGVETTAGEAEVRVPCGIDTSYGYQFNAINGTNTYVIYAQTPKFYISGGPCEDPSTTPTCAAATVTVTVSKTLSGNYTTTPGPKGPAVVTHIRTVTSAVCPDTIGWSSGYDHPVTLTSAPHPPGVAPTTTPAPNAGGAWSSKDADETTSTVYTTVYKELVLTEGCSC